MVSLPACLPCNTVCYGVVSGWLHYVTFMPFEKQVFAFRAYVNLVGICFERNDFFFFFFINAVFEFLTVRLL
jgi:hypothetical protein